MPTMGRYCKAYPVAQLRGYPGWWERAENMRSEAVEQDGREVRQRRQLHEESFLYLHENYVVTDGIYLDENVIFDGVTDEWKLFCQEQLGFRLPVFAANQPAPDPATDP